MRRPLDSAVIRRDDQLIRTRRLTGWLTGGATAASLGLAGVLGIAIPGKAVTSAGHASSAQSSPAAGRRSGPPGHTGSSGHRNHRIAPPAAPPSGSTAPPVVSSGGS
jgi:hypothetical protein